MSPDALSPRQIQECVLKGLRQSGRAAVTVLARFSGAINDVYRVAVDDAEYCLRIRSRAGSFMYEKNFLKEPVIWQFLSHTQEDHGEANEQLLDRLIGSAANSGTGGPFTCSLCPELIFYDRSLATFPFLWTLQEWAPGVPLDMEGTDDRYRDFGRTMALLHKAKFRSFKSTFLAPWQPHNEWLALHVDAVNQFCRDVSLAPNIAPILQRLAGTSLVFSLIHNDSQPMNAISHGGKVVLIDWDNAQIAPAELDLAKIMYWTRRDADGFLSQDETLFNEFCDSYVNEGGIAINNDLLQFCRILWLTRIITFERIRARAGHKHKAPFHDAAFYESILRSTLLELNRCGR